MTPLRRLTLLALASCIVVAAEAQVMSLREVVDRAVEQSLTVDAARQQVTGARVNQRESELSRYPTLALQNSGGYQFGLNVDPTTNLLERQTIGFLNFSLDASATLYAGGRINNTIAQNRASVAAAEADLAASEQDVALQAAQLYLEALLAREAQDNAATLRDQAAAQLRVLNARIEAGALAPVQRFELESTVARQEQRVIAAENAARLARLRLAQLLRLPPDDELRLATAETLDFDAVLLPEVTAAELYAAALERQPSVRAARLGEEAAALGVDVARAGYYPTLSVFGQANTRYSSQAVDPVFDGTETVEEQRVVLNGQEVTFGIPRQNVTLVERPLTDQLSDFFGQAVGLSLRVPIFQQGRNDAAVGRARNLAEQARTRREQAELELRTQTEQALLNAVNARAEVAAARRALNAAQASYDAAVRRAEFGAGNDFDLTDQQLLLEQAQNALLQARYQYVFNAKVVDFYLGRPLEL